MSTVIAIHHIKGGVGKTASAVNLSYLAADSGYQTLLCDLDPQSSATYYFRIKPKLKTGTRGLVRGGKELEKNIKGTDYRNLDLLPSDFSLRNLDLDLDKKKKSKSRFDASLTPCKGKYDIIFLDCPPNITMVTENVFRAADFILVPLIPTTLSVRTFDQLRNFAGNTKCYARIYAFFSMVERRKKLHRETMRQLQSKFNIMMDSSIPYFSDVEKMGIYREPVLEFAPRSRSALAYRSLWDEIQRKLI